MLSPQYTSINNYVDAGLDAMYHIVRKYATGEYFTSHVMLGTVSGQY